MRFAPTWMTRQIGVLGLLAVALAACAGAPPRPPPAAPPQPAIADEDEHEDEEPPPASSELIDAPERSRPPSTASYEQAMSTPEKLDTNDGRTHLTDDQLRGPMRGVISRCAIPRNAKVTIRTAVQDGRAIGVSVDVMFDHPPATAPTRARHRPSRAAAQRAAAAAQRQAKAEAKKKRKIAACFDRVVRAAVWPPSSRRDSFTTEF